MLNQQIAALRKDYIQASLNEEDVAPSPFSQFDKWWKDAEKSEIDEMNAMTLTTSTVDGRPSARIVLLKSYDEEGFMFFTNYESRKGQELAENPHVCLLFFWKELERQVRIEGTVSKASAAESDQYYNSRPLGSRIGAIASPQSKVIPDRLFLEQQVERVTNEFKDREPVRPEYWGGYIVRPTLIEFWQGRSSRLHDRIVYTITPEGNWTIARLAP
ncbi:Pyridoxamine 5'-phosphate oxidase [Chitinophaga terrae (ex Kim and Jung 2007)]|uniref:Pyridoxine/pyridoxamine 5'-phosphate oxidase n=1 Tax=Chitinophaga terrae (ex Kim and Jung 2007) TaxID=408074 RepID=A0A1H4G7B0_9BACT|nr:pyridoxamine 5'-phosphate oxidase [Chitinophaga terrae (ex Kim and Jung 2007)]GEP93064.1 pyridoxine/pyridoxamine 5'-phosphate oxidase [Chitinophaga terrae (ex Kim and Jung 2007)]SEB05485.1 Pyridoxamine 5'-phosphate oxidase [Chitinophaga terrae (ex Kim and Jung 2007)]